MLVHDNQYLENLQGLINDAQNVSMAVAFWGAGSESIFKDWNGKSLRIICNLALGGTNPTVIGELMKRKNTEVLQLDDLHAKLVLTEKAMIVGSANISSNGLGLEDGEAAGFRELGILSRNKGQLDGARVWFDEIWNKKARKIAPSDLDAAQEAWKKRRKARPKIKFSDSKSLLDMTASELQKREIYFVIYRKELSPEAKVLLEEAREKNDKLDAYEDVKGFPKGRDAVIIPIHWEKDGEITIQATQDVKRSSRTEDGEGSLGPQLDFTVMARKSRPDPFLFTAPHRRELEKSIGPWLTSIRKERLLDEDYAGCVPVYKFLKWREKQKPG